MTNKIKILTALFLIVFFVIAVYFSIKSYLGSNKNYTQENTTETEESRLTKKQTEEKIIKEDEENLKDFSDYTSIKNQKEYIEELNKKIKNPNLSNTSKNLLLLRKAAVMATVRSDEDNNTKEVNSIIKSIVESKIENELDLFTKDFAIVTFLKLNFQNRFINDVSSVYPETVDKYKKLGYKDTLLTLISLNEIVSYVSKERKDDNNLIAVSIAIKSEIVNVYEKEVNKETYNLILKNLGDDLVLFNTSKLKTFTDPYNTTLESSLFYSYGYDIYQSKINKILSVEVNKKIDKNYEEVFTKLNSSEYGDKISINMMTVFNSMRYTTSLNKRYGKNIDNKRLDEVIKNTLKAINYSEETQTITNMYIKENFYKGGYANWSYFISLGKTRDDVNNYIKSIGINVRG